MTKYKKIHYKLGKIFTLIEKDLYIALVVSGIGCILFYRFITVLSFINRLVLNKEF